jgi:large subunit ribosomal protein L19
VSNTTIEEINKKYLKPQVVDVHSGDTVRVHQKIREGNKERIQVFQGLVIRVDRSSSHTHRITVRRISSGIGVEKSFLMHSPLVLKVEVTKRSKVRRNYLSYMRALTGKATRLSAISFDNQAVNTVTTEEEVAEVKASKEIDNSVIVPETESKAVTDSVVETVKK